MRLKYAVVLLVVALSAAVGCRDKGPRVTIGMPKDESHFPRGDTIHFAADLNSDADVGVVPASAWSWSSDKDGDLGNSPRLDTPNLSTGKHVITVIVPHRLGTSSSTVTVYVDSSAAR